MTDTTTAQVSAKAFGLEGDMARATLAGRIADEIWRLCGPEFADAVVDLVHEELEEKGLVHASRGFSDHKPDAVQRKGLSASLGK